MTSELHLASKALELRKGKKSAATAVRPRKESLLYMGEDSDMDSSSESEEGDGSAPVGNRYLGGGGGAVGLFGGGRPRSVADSLRMLTEQAELHEMELQRLDAQINAVLHELVEQGNSVVVIEHNLEVVKTADWVIDMGPEGGDGGGVVVAEGTPEAIVKAGKGHTARFLKEVLERRPIAKGKAVRQAAE